MIIPYNFSIYDTTNWILDTRNPTHICNSLQKLQNNRKFENSEKFLNVGDGNEVPILALRVVELVFNSDSIILSDCHYCPSFLMNIISVSFLTKDGYYFSIKNNYCDIIMNGVTIIRR